MRTVPPAQVMMVYIHSLVNTTRSFAGIHASSQTMVKYLTAIAPDHMILLLLVFAIFDAAHCSSRFLVPPVALRTGSHPHHEHHDTLITP